MRWTAADEAELKRLQEKKKSSDEYNLGCVERTVIQFHFREMNSTSLVESLVENATVIRKVLEPFDKEVQQ